MALKAYETPEGGHHWMLLQFGRLTGANKGFAVCRKQYTALSIAVERSSRTYEKDMEKKRSKRKMAVGRQRKKGCIIYHHPTYLSLAILFFQEDD